MQVCGEPRLSGEQRDRGRHAGDAQQVPPVGRPADPLRAGAPARIPRAPQLRQRRLRCLNCVQNVCSGRTRRSSQGQSQALIVSASILATRPPSLTPPAPPAPPLPPGTHGTGAMAASAVGVAGKGKAICEGFVSPALSRARLPLPLRFASATSYAKNSCKGMRRQDEALVSKGSIRRWWYVRQAVDTDARRMPRSTQLCQRRHLKV